MIRAVRIALAGLVAAAAGLVGLAAPAQAAACPRGTGVTVVVQGQGLNSTRCDAGGAGTASGNFGAVGHSLTRVSSQPGFVCRVDGRPNISCQSTPPADAYWGLYWSNGNGGGWVYSNSGVGSLRVPKGGWVAFVFQDGGRRTPSVTPRGPAPQPTAKPTQAPKPKPAATKETAKPEAVKTTPGGQASTEAPGDEKGEAKKGGATEGKATPSADATSATSDDLTSTAAESDDSSTGLLWVAGGLVLFLVVAGVATVRARARRT